MSVQAVSHGSCCTVCGDILASSNGEFYSPKTASSTTCVWRIRVEKGYYIKLRLVMSPLGQPGAGHCLGPYVDVKETVVSQLQGRYCVDGKTHTIESNSSHLYVSFTHDLRNPSRGFTASYTSMKNRLLFDIVYMLSFVLCCSNM